MSVKFVDPDEVPDEVRAVIEQDLREKFGNNVNFLYGTAEGLPEELEEVIKAKAEEHQRVHQIGFFEEKYVQIAQAVEAIQYHGDEDDGGNLDRILMFCKRHHIPFCMSNSGCVYVPENLGEPDVDRDILNPGDFIVYRPDINSYRKFSCVDFERDFTVSYPEPDEPEDVLAASDAVMSEEQDQKIYGTTSDSSGSSVTEQEDETVYGCMEGARAAAEINEFLANDDEAYL